MSGASNKVGGGKEFAQAYDAIFQNQSGSPVMVVSTANAPTLTAQETIAEPLAATEEVLGFKHMGPSAVEWMTNEFRQLKLTFALVYDGVSGGTVSVKPLDAERAAAIISGWGVLDA